MQEGPSKIVKREFITLLERAIDNSFPGSGLDELQIDLSISVPEPSLGDLSSSIAFKLAKLAKADPKTIAQKIASKMVAGKYLQKFSYLNGYVNAFLDGNKYSELVLGIVAADKDEYGKSERGKGNKVIVEFPSVNPAHPWHVGHVRNALLGCAVSNLLEYCSYEVEREDYIDDLGLQMATSLWGWFHISDKPDKKFDQWLGELYVKVNKEEAENGDITKGINELLKKMEDAYTEEAMMGRKVAEKCVMAQLETAFAYGIYHDVMIWESDIVRAKLLSKALALASEKGVTEKPSKGKYADATVVRLEKITKHAKELEGSREDSKVIVRSNGAATYIAKDFAFHSWKFGLIDANFKYRKFVDMQPNGKPVFTTSPEGSEMSFGKVKKAINVIDAGQTYEQLIMKVMFSLLGHEEIARNLVHLAYGKVSLEGEKLSARKGNWLGEGKNYTADDLLRETKERALEIASKSEKITNKSDVETIANAIALSAIKFEYLRMAPERAMVFSWDTALNFEGNSGPYAMYTYARASRILEKAGNAVVQPTCSLVSKGIELELVKQIGMFQEIVEKACDEFRPNAVTDYLLDVASKFSKFYETVPVLNSGEAMLERLAIVSATKQVTKNALALLGIGVVERM